MDFWEFMLARKLGGSGGAKAHVATFDHENVYERVEVPAMNATLTKISDETPSMSDLEGSVFAMYLLGMPVGYGNVASVELGTLAEVDFTVAKVPTILFDSDPVVISVATTVDLGGVTIPAGLYQVDTSGLVLSKIIWVT